MKDFERENVSEWDTENKAPAQRRFVAISGLDVRQVNEGQGAKLTPSPSAQARQHHGPSIQAPKRETRPQRRYPPERVVQKLTESEGNAAEAQWRKRQASQDRVRIPELLLRAEKRAQVATLDVLARQHKVFLAPDKHGRYNDDDRTFGIWGEKDDVAAAKTAILVWVEDMTGPQRASQKFPKLASLTPKLREREEKRWLRELRRQEFRQHPNHSTIFEAIGTFKWPWDDVAPTEILGANCEALDPIRMDCECYLVYIPDETMFRVMGSAKHVKAAVKRLEKTCVQIEAKQIEQTRMYLLHWPETIGVAGYVCIDEYHLPATLIPESAAAMETASMPRALGTGMDDDSVAQAAAITASSRTTAYESILETLKKLHFYRGTIKMRIRLGTFLATQYKATTDGEYGMEEYRQMITESQFMGHVTQEVGNLSTEQAILQTLLASDDLLSPHDNTLEHLGEVRAEYEAIFTFGDEAGDLRLFVKWQETQDPDAPTSDFEQKVLRWTRLDRDTGAPTALLDISSTDLHQSSSWQFDILASQTVESHRLPPQLLRFAEHLRIDAAAARKQSPYETFAKYNPYATNLKTLQQRVLYNYRIAIGNSDYTLELSRFQDRTFPDRRSPAADGATATVVEPRWSVNIFREDWDTMLAQNERLAIGTETDWSDDASVWFPEDLVSEPKARKGKQKLNAEEAVREPEADLGWKQLMVKLAKIEEVVQGAASLENALGGMTVD